MDGTKWVDGRPWPTRGAAEQVASEYAAAGGFQVWYDKKG